MIRQLIELEVSEHVAKAAVQKVKSLDLDESYMWTFDVDEDDDEEMIDQLVKEFEQEESRFKKISDYLFQTIL